MIAEAEAGSLAGAISAHFDKQYKYSFARVMVAVVELYKA
jgi:hypothetical protein